MAPTRPAAGAAWPRRPGGGVWGGKPWWLRRVCGSKEAHGASPAQP